MYQSRLCDRVSDNERSHNHQYTKLDREATNIKNDNEFESMLL
ncbi:MULTISPECIES: hypothetical protein [Oscillatoriales]|nr:MULTISPECIES: hypothetical protein [Oscillatoriales]